MSSPAKPARAGSMVGLRTARRKRPALRRLIAVGLVALGVASVAPAAAFAEAPPSLSPSPRPQPVDLNNKGQLSNGTVTSGVSVTPDGRYALFGSNAPNLPGPTAQADVHPEYHMYRRDLKTGRTVPASDPNCAGRTNGDDPGRGRAMTPDGRYVVYTSAGDCGGPPSGTNHTNIFRYDIQTGTTRPVSVTSDGVKGNQESAFPSISDDGRYVAFESRAYNLQDGDDSQSAWHVYVHDTVTGRTQLIDRQPDGTATPDPLGFVPSNQTALSGDGTKLLYGLSTGQPDGTSVRYRNLVTGADRLISTGCCSILSSLSRDGRFITYYPNNDETRQPVLLDLKTNSIRPATPVPTGSPYTSCDIPLLSPTNRYLVYRCRRPADEPAYKASWVLYRRDRTTGSVTRVDTLPGQQVAEPSTYPTLAQVAADGAVLFTSPARELVPVDAPPGAHVMLAPAP